MCRCAPAKDNSLVPDSSEAIVEKSKASVRAKGEHPFRYVKRMFQYEKVRYQGLEKEQRALASVVWIYQLLISDRYQAA